jgi:hypothetical protein
MQQRQQRRKNRRPNGEVEGVNGGGGKGGGGKGGGGKGGGGKGGGGKGGGVLDRALTEVGERGRRACKRMELMVGGRKL